MEDITPLELKKRIGENENLHIIDVREVWDLCLRAKFLSDGAFDPWAVEGGFDPSGLVILIS